MARISFSVQLGKTLFLIKLAILKNNIEMLLESIMTNLSVPNKEIESAAPSQEFGSPN